MILLFYCIFDQINATLMNIQDFDLKKILPTLKFWLLMCVSEYSHNQHIKLTALSTINNSHTYKLLCDMWPWNTNLIIVYL